MEGDFQLEIDYIGAQLTGCNEDNCKQVRDSVLFLYTGIFSWNRCCVPQHTVADAHEQSLELAHHHHHHHHQFITLAHFSGVYALARAPTRTHRALVHPHARGQDYVYRAPSSSKGTSPPSTTTIYITPSVSAARTPATCLGPLLTAVALGWVLARR